MGISLIAAAVIGGTAAAINGNQQKAAAGRAQRENMAQAQKTAEMSSEAQNKANARSPDMNGILAANRRAAGISSGTLLTGPTGADQSTLSLGKNTLLGS